jgi:hypothetical protein
MLVASSTLMLCPIYQPMLWNDHRILAAPNICDFPRIEAHANGHKVLLLLALKSCNRYLSKPTKAKSSESRQPPASVSSVYGCHSCCETVASRPYFTSRAVSLRGNALEDVGEAHYSAHDWQPGRPRWLVNVM